MIWTAASSDSVLRSGILVFAISSTWLIVIVATLTRLGSPEPLSSPAALRSRNEAGGVLVMKLYVRSAYTVMMVGMMMPC